VYAEEGIELRGSARIKGSAGTNSVSNRAVDLTWSTGIDSTLYIGRSGRPEIVVYQENHDHGNVGDGIENFSTVQSFPMPEFPEYPAKNVEGYSITTVWQNEPYILEPSDYDGVFIPLIRVIGNRNITIDVGNENRVMHVREFDIQQGHIYLNGTGTLTLYVEDKLIINGSVNGNGLADQLFVYYRGSDHINLGGSSILKGGVFLKDANLTIGNSGGFQGHIVTGGETVNITGNAEAITRMIYAPNAHVSMGGSGRVTGAIVAKSFYAVGVGQVTYNPAWESELPELDFGAGAGDFNILSWN